MLFDMKPGAFNTAYGEFSVVTHYGSGTPKIFATVNSKGYYIDFAVSTAATQWNHLVFQLIYDSTAGNFDIKLYINGTDSSVTPTGTKPTTGQIDFSSGDTVIGGISTGQNYNGKIDEASMFNYALSSAQVLEIYNNGKPSNLSNYSGTAPINWWRLGENAYFDNNNVTLPNSITGGPNGVSSGTATSMLSADAPGTYANGIGTNLDIVDRVGEAPLSIANSQSYNIIPSDISSYVPQYIGKQIANNFSMTLDGTNDYFDAGDSDIFSFGNGTTDSPFSISAWINMDDATRFRIVSKFNSVNNNEYIFTTSANDELGINLYDDSANARISRKYTTALTSYQGQWIHVASTYDGSGASSGIRLYLNGLRVDDANNNSGTYVAMENLAQPFYIGQQAGSYANGKIDEVAIFDTALNAGQIYNDIYQPTATGTNQTADLANNPNLPTPVAWYRMGD